MIDVCESCPVRSLIPKVVEYGVKLTPVSEPYSSDALEDDAELMASRGEPSNAHRSNSKQKKEKGKDRAKDRELQRLLLYEVSLDASLEMD